MRTAQKGMLALIFMVAESAFVTIALQVGGASIGPIPLIFYTSLVGILTMLPISYIEDRGRGLSEIFGSPKTLAVLTVAGLLDYTFSRLLLIVGTMGTTPSISSIVFRTYPILIVFLTPLLLRQKVSKKQMAALMLCFASVYVIVSGGGSVAVVTQQLPYIALTLVAALAVAVSTLLIKWYNASTTGIVIVANMATFLVSLPLALVFHASIPLALAPSVLTSILFIGGIEDGLGVMLYYYSYKAFNTSFVGNAVLAVPFLTILFSALLLGTPIKPYYIAAAALLAIGIFVQGRESLSAPERLNEGSSSDGLFEKIVLLDITGAFANSATGNLRQYMSGNGRALAIKLEPGVTYDKRLDGKYFRSRNCIAFTNGEPHKAAAQDDIDFANEMMEISGGETALIGMGDPKALEEAFKDFVFSDRSWKRVTS